MESAELSELTKSQVSAFGKFQKTRDRIDNIISKPAEIQEVKPALTDLEPTKPEPTVEMDESILDKILGLCKFNL